MDVLISNLSSNGILKFWSDVEYFHSKISDAGLISCKKFTKYLKYFQLVDLHSMK